MNNIISRLCLSVLVLLLVETVLGARKIDSKQLKCLVCKTTIKELDEAIAKIDPSHKIDVGGYRIDAKGNLQQKQVSKAKSEIHLSEVASGICDTLDNYIRGMWKDDDTLTVLKLIEDGQMNSKFSLINIIQDDDLNKSLKYYCEQIIEENEDTIINEYINEVENVAESVCIQHATYCTPADFIETEHIAVPGSEDDFASQFGLNQNFNFEENQQKSEEPVLDETQQKSEEPVLEETTEGAAQLEDVKDEL